MKILLATYWSIPHLGGVWNYMVQLKNKLELLGHEVDMLGYDEENLSVHIVNQNIVIDRDEILPVVKEKLNEQTNPDIFVNKLVKYTAMQRNIYELSVAKLKLDKYDVIHTQDVISTTSFSRVKPKNIPLVATLHGSVAHEIRQQLTTVHKSDTSFMARVYYDELEKTGATAAEVTIVANQWLKNILMDEFGVLEDQIRVLHYGFETENFIKRMKEKSSIIPPKDKKIILYSGRLVELKGVQHLIVALSELKELRDDWVCWIVGDGDHMPKLKMLSKIFGLEDDIFFFGKRDNIPYLISCADIFVLPSLLENQPLSVIEAQIAGKAIIVSNAGGLPEMVEDGVTGLITPAGDVKSLTQKIYLLLEDENLRKELGTNAKNWGMSHWSIDKGVKKLLKIYKSVIYKNKNKVNIIGSKLKRVTKNSNKNNEKNDTF